MYTRRRKLAILDMYDNTPNKGMGNIKALVDLYKDELDWQVFDVRGKAEVPDTSFDIYISTGGPGNPLDGDGIWDKKYYDLIDQLWKMNKVEEGPKKHVFFICHSFQMVCHHFNLAQITKRHKRSFGTYRAHKTPAGKKEVLFDGLADPFYVADFRDYQVVQPNYDAIDRIGAKIALLEKIRPNVDFERAIMAVRLSDEFFATQFHPEADPVGMVVHFEDPKQREAVINEHGIEKYEKMLRDLNDPDKIENTYRTILPAFLETAIEALNAELVVA